MWDEGKMVALAWKVKILKSRVPPFIHLFIIHVAGSFYDSLFYYHSVTCIERDRSHKLFSILFIFFSEGKK